LENEELKEALRGAVEEVMRLPAIRRRKNIRCAYVVKVGYEEIRKLRNEGYSYDTICAALVAKGVFDEGAAPKSLGMAFRRETSRRARREQRENGKPEREKSAAADKPDISSQEAREKRVRELTGGPVIKAGAGTIRKLPGGTFEF
jgi:hypothetical protein